MANKGSFLATGQYLSVGDYLVSDNSEFYAIMQSDGNFVLYLGSGPSDNQGYIWSISHTALPTGQYFAIMQADGNFVVYHGSDPAHQGTPIWATNTSGQSFVYAVMQSDGNFVLYRGSGPGDIQGFVWATNTPWATQPHRVTTGDRLTVGQWLATGDHLVSGNGQYVAKMQDDGNFVVAQVSPDQALWTSNTVRGHGQYVAIMQSDGNFVVYQGSDPAHQGTPIWATNTSWVSHRVTTGNSLTQDDWLGTNDYLLSSNQLYAAIMQSDGNFVLYHTTYSTSPTVRPRPDTNRPFWASNTNRSQGQSIAVLKEDGHFILHEGPASGEEKDLTSYWSAGSQQNDYASLQAIMQDDGNFVLYKWAYGQQQPYWATNTVAGVGEKLTIVSGNNQTQPRMMTANGGRVAIFAPLSVVLTDNIGDPYAGKQITWRALTPTWTMTAQISSDSPLYPVTTTTDSNGNATLNQMNYFISSTQPNYPGGGYSAVVWTDDNSDGPFTVTASSDRASATFNLATGGSPASALSATILAGNNQSVARSTQVGWNFPVALFAPLQVKVLNPNGTPVSEVPVGFACGSIPQGMTVVLDPGTFDNPIRDTDGNGIATLSSVTAYGAPGTFAVVVSIAYDGQLTFNETVSR